MTSQSRNSSIKPGVPLTSADFVAMAAGLPVKAVTPEQQAAREAALEMHEQARQRFVAQFSSHPLYAARAAKDPEFWNKFSVGGFNF